MPDYNRFPNHQCDPIPFIFGLGYLQTKTRKNLADCEQVFRSQRREGFKSIPVGWEGITKFEQMARRLAAASLKELAKHPYRPIVIGGASAGAASAILACELLLVEGQHWRVAGLRPYSTTPGFGHVWKNFLRKHAATDVDFNKLGMGKPGRIPGKPLPILPVPVVASYGRKEGDFMREQAEALECTLPRARITDIGYTEHHISFPGHAATTTSSIFDLSLIGAETFDASKATWHRQPRIDLDYAYTGFGSAAILERGSQDPRVINLGALACLMKRIHDGDTPSRPDEDNEINRYAMCAPAERGLAFDPAVHAYLGRVSVFLENPI